MTIDPVILSRLQFAWVVAFHILLPAFTVGLASYIALNEGLYFATKREIYFRISAFWTKIFAISFGMGVVSGIVMPFQFGTNWSRFSDITANVLSPLFAYEGLTAFFLEAAFLGVLLFGRNLVPRWAHFFSAVMVALGTLISTFWILSANSWMQTPQGYELIDGRFFPVSWFDVIFNPSFPYRLFHNVVAFYITTAFVVIAVASHYIIKRTAFMEEAKVMLSVTLWLLTILVPLQVFLGDLHGLNTLEHQPAKLAAIEGHWEQESRAPLILFAIPDEKREMNRFSIEVPLLGSLILTHKLDGVVPGLKSWAPQDRAPVIVTFFSFRLMVLVGLIMLGVVLGALWLRYRDRLYTSEKFLRLLRLTGPLGFIAVLAGWVTTEAGRQPWTVYGLLRTKDSVTPSLTSIDVLFSLAGYIVVYLIIFPVGYMLMKRIIRRGPQFDIDAEDSSVPTEGGQPRSPIVSTPTEHQ